MKKLALSVVAIAFALPIQASATEFKVEITNLTNANYFTPLLVSAHSRQLDMFELGEPASEAMQAIAEGGTTGPMQAALEGGKASVAIAETSLPNSFLAPGETAVAVVDASRLNRRLSLAAMILPTNDAFVGLDSINLSRLFQRTFFLRSYDAGTEVNDEIVNGGGASGVPGIPGDPSGRAGSNATGVTDVEINQTVHIHRGIIGDDDPEGGSSDLDSTQHRWNDPVARVTITRIFKY